MIARHEPSVFAKVSTSLDTHVLDDNALSIISEIATQVTSSSYKRTPNFNLKQRRSGGGGRRHDSSDTNSRGFPKTSGHGGSGGGGREYKARPGNNKPVVVREMSEQEWQVLRNFESTKMEQKQGTELSITKITGEMNKLTNDTFDNIVQTVTDEVNRTREANDTASSDMECIANVIFDIASNNKFYSSLYAKFASSMIDTFDEMKSMIQSKFADTSKIISNIEYCPPDEDYDAFCENNKKNDKRRALCSFYANLLLQDIISVSDIIDTIIRFQTELAAGAMNKAFRNKNEEIAEVTCILISESKSKLTAHASWNQVIGEVKQVAEINPKKYQGITNKTVFRFMDIIEELS